MASSPDALFRLAWKALGTIAAVAGLLALIAYSDAGWLILAAYLIGWLHTIWCGAADA